MDIREPISSLVRPIRENGQWVFLLFVLALSYYTRIQGIEQNPIAIDEPFSIFHAQMAIPDLIGEISKTNNPPLYELFLHFWTGLVGISPFAVRLPSLLAGVATVGVVFLIGKRFIGTRVGVMASLLTCFSEYHLYFSHEARVYSILTLLTVSSIFLFLEICVNENRSKKLLWGQFLIYTLLAYSHYFGIVVIFFQVASFFFFQFNKRGMLLDQLKVLGGVLLAYSVNIPVLFSRFYNSSGGTWVAPVENLGHLHNNIFFLSNEAFPPFAMLLFLLWCAAGIHIIQEWRMGFLRWIIAILPLPVLYLSELSIYHSMPQLWKLTSNEAYIFGFPILIVLGLTGNFLFRGKRFPVRNFLILFAVLPLLLFFLLSFKLPVFRYRYLLFILPAFYLMVSMALDRLFPRTVSFSMVGSMFLGLFIIYFSTHVPNKREPQNIAQKVEELRSKGSGTFILPAQYKLNFAYHYDRDLFLDPEALERSLKEKNIFPISSKNELQKGLKKIRDKEGELPNNVALVDAHSELILPGNQVHRALTERYSEKEVSEYKGKVKVYHFKK